MQDDWDCMVAYAREFLDIVRDDYRVVWWKLFNCADSSRWHNILRIEELFFCLPVASGHLEQVYLQLKMTKTDRRTCLAEETLDDLMRINVSGPALADWDPDSAIDHWWREGQRRPTSEY